MKIPEYELNDRVDHQLLKAIEFDFCLLDLALLFLRSTIKKWLGSCVSNKTQDKPRHVCVLKLREKEKMNEPVFCVYLFWHCCHLLAHLLLVTSSSPLVQLLAPFF
jgi:hypothetical protein